MLQGQHLFQHMDLVIGCSKQSSNDDHNFVGQKCVRHLLGNVASGSQPIKKRMISSGKMIGFCGCDLPRRRRSYEEMVDRLDKIGFDD